MTKPELRAGKMAEKLRRRTFNKTKKRNKPLALAEESSYTWG